MTSEKQFSAAGHWIFMTVLIIEISLFSNNASGWTSLVVIMKEEGVFGHLCQEKNITLQTSALSTRACSKQNERFSFILTLTWTVALTSSLLVGALVDRFDVKFVRILGSLGYCLGMVLLAFSSYAHPEVMLPGAVLSHLGGTTLFICSCRAVTVFGKWHSLVLSVLNGAMITSGVMFSILKVLYRSGIGKEYLFVSVGCGSLVVMVATFLLHPPLDQSHGVKTRGDKFSKTPKKLVNKPRNKEKTETRKVTAERPKKQMCNDSYNNIKKDHIQRKHFSHIAMKIFNLFKDRTKMGQIQNIKSNREDLKKTLNVIDQEKPCTSPAGALPKHNDKNSTRSIDNLKQKALIAEKCCAVNTEVKISLYQDSQSVGLKSEDKNKIYDDKDDAKNACSSLLQLLVSGGFIWGVVFVGVCRFRLLLFLVTFLQFVANQPGANVDTAETYSINLGLVQTSSLFIGLLLGVLITAGKDKEFMQKSCSCCFHLLANISKLLGWKSERSSLRHHDVDIVKEDKLPIEHAQKEKNSFSQSLVFPEADQDDNAIAKLGEIRGCLISFSVTGFFLLAFGVAVLVPNVQVQVLSMVLVTLMRVFFNGGISNMLLAMFPREHFGVLFAINSIATVFICFLQYPFFLVVENYFHGDMFWPNVILLALSFIVLGLPVYLWRYMKKLQFSMLVAPNFLRKSTSATNDGNKSETIVYYEVYELLTVV